MGIGPWAQGDLIRDIQREERARFRRLIRKEQKTMTFAPSIKQFQLRAMFDRLLDATAAKRKKRP